MPVGVRLIPCNAVSTLSAKCGVPTVPRSPGSPLTLSNVSTNASANSSP